MSSNEEAGDNGIEEIVDVVEEAPADSENTNETPVEENNVQENPEDAENTPESTENHDGSAEVTEEVKEKSSSSSSDEDKDKEEEKEDKKEEKKSGSSDEEKEKKKSSSSSDEEKDKEKKEENAEEHKEETDKGEIHIEGENKKSSSSSDDEKEKDKEKSSSSSDEEKDKKEENAEDHTEEKNINVEEEKQKSNSSLDEEKENKEENPEESKEEENKKSSSSSDDEKEPKNSEDAQIEGQEREFNPANMTQEELDAKEIEEKERQFNLEHQDTVGELTQSETNAGLVEFGGTRHFIPNSVKTSSNVSTVATSLNSDGEDEDTEPPDQPPFNCINAYDGTIGPRYLVDENGEQLSPPVVFFPEVIEPNTPMITTLIGSKPSTPRTNTRTYSPVYQSQNPQNRSLEATKESIALLETFLHPKKTKSKKKKLFTDLENWKTAVDAAGMTPLHHVAANPAMTEKALELISAGADVNQVDLKRNTPLHTAALAKNAPMINILLRGGANPNLSNYDGYTPLHIAIMNRDCSTVAALIHPKENCSVLTRDGRSPFYLAVEFWNEKIIKMLIDVDPKIDTTYPDRDQKTPLDIIKPEETAKYNFLSKLLKMDRPSSSKSGRRC